MSQTEGQFLQKRAPEFLENAYFTARYFPVEFEVREVKNMESFVNSLLILLKQPLD